MKTSFPAAAIPFEKPFGFAQPGGCRIWIMALFSRRSSA
jgi:hypothetical protein